MVTPAAKRQAVAHACDKHGVSQRRACAILNIDRSTVRYTSVRPDDAYLREAMKKVAAERRRFGYRRIHVMLERQGISINQKKLRRLYREEKLQVRKRGDRKRALGTRRPMVLLSTANERLLSSLLRNDCRAMGAWTSCQMRSRTDDGSVFLLWSTTLAANAWRS